MGFWSWLLKDDLNTRDETITPPVSDVLLKALLNNEVITREKALTLPVVSGAVDFITNSVASMPVKLYKVKQGKVEELTDDIRVKLLNCDTGDTLDAFQLKKAMVEDYLLGKGGYCYIQRDRNDVVALRYVEDQYITILKNFKPIYKSYEILVEGQNYQPYEFIKLLRNTKDGGSGVGLTAEVSKALETAYQTLLYQLSQVQAGGNKKGFLKSQRTLGQEEINALKKAWKNMYGNGQENVVVLNNGIEFQESGASAMDMQLDQNKNTLRSEINYIFHINEGDFELTFKEAIYPIIKAFETALNRDLLLEKEKKNHFFEFDVKEIVKASLIERYNAYKTAKETGWLSYNEIRKMENMEYVDGLDVVNVGLGAVLYDLKTHKYYTPNTDTVSDPNDGSNGETPDEAMDMMLEQHELVEAYDESGNSAERQIRYNDVHDSKTGRFGSKWGGAVGAMEAEFNALPDNKKALYLFKNEFLSKEDSLKYWKEGNIDQYGKEYFQILRENGDYNPVGETRDNTNRASDLARSGKYSTYGEARKAVLKQDTGFSDEEVERTYNELNTWVSNSWSKADTAILDKYVDNSPTYNGKMFRGMHFDTPEEAEKFVNLKAGDRITGNGKNSSWTSDEEMGRVYSHNGNDSFTSVNLVCLKNKTSSPIEDFNLQGESEILSSSKAEWTVLRNDVVTLPNGNKKIFTYVVEAENGSERKN